VRLRLGAAILICARNPKQKQAAASSRGREAHLIELAPLGEQQDTAIFAGRSYAAECRHGAVMFDGGAIMNDRIRKPTTTDAGFQSPAMSSRSPLGPTALLLQDHYLIEQMANFNRERIPQRQPHAKGGGAFGRFQVTKDVSKYTKAAMFQPGTKTDMLVRFSTVAGERGSPDRWRPGASTPLGCVVRCGITTPKLNRCC
jgi:Catalase